MKTIECFVCGKEFIASYKQLERHMRRPHHHYCCSRECIGRVGLMTRLQREKKTQALRGIKNV